MDYNHFFSMLKKCLGSYITIVENYTVSVRHGLWPYLHCLLGLFSKKTLEIKTTNTKFTTMVY